MAKCFQFKIKLEGISKPPVWRKILVPANTTFKEFANLIISAFGWDGYHLWSFSPRGYGSRPTISVPNRDDWERPDIDARKCSLEQYFADHDGKLRFIYDFGDDWFHSIVLEEVVEVEKPKCILLKAKGTTPPEDCGGVWGYEHLKEVLSDPTHPEYEDLAEWAGLEPGEVWDPDDPEVCDGQELSQYDYGFFNEEDEDYDRDWYDEDEMMDDFIPKEASPEDKRFQEAHGLNDMEMAAIRSMIDMLKGMRTKS